MKSKAIFTLLLILILTVSLCGCIERDVKVGHRTNLSDEELDKVGVIRVLNSSASKYNWWDYSIFIKSDDRNNYVITQIYRDVNKPFKEKNVKYEYLTYSKNGSKVKYAEYVSGWYHDQEAYYHARMEHYVGPGDIPTEPDIKYRPANEIPNNKITTYELNSRQQYLIIDDKYMALGYHWDYTTGEWVIDYLKNPDKSYEIYTYEDFIRR